MRTIVNRGRKFTTYQDTDYPGKYVMEIGGHDMHYRDTLGDWQPVVEQFDNDGLDGFSWKAVKMNHGLRMGNTGSRRWIPRIERPEEYVTIGRPQYRAGNQWRNLTFSSYSVAGNAVTFTAANYTLTLEINWRRVKMTLVLANSSAPVRYRFPMSLTGITYNAGALTANSDGAAVGNVTPTTAQDANAVDLAVTDSYNGGYVEFTVDVTGAVYPVTVDPDFAGDTADGYVRGRDSSYSTARSTLQFSSISATSLALGQYLSGGLYYNFRSFLKFDTSSIDDAATVTQVNLKLTPTADNSDTDFDVQIVKQDWSAQEPITAGSGEIAYDNCLAGTADDSIWRNTNGISINTAYTSGNLSTAWINKTGATYYSLRSSRDYGNTAPTGNEHINIGSQNHTTTAYRPVLVVVYGSGGTQYPQSVSGSITPSGALSFQTGKILSGGITPAGAIAKQARRLLTGSLTLSGALATAKTVLKSLAGALSPSGTLSRRTGKALSGTVTSAGAIQKRTAKSFAGALTSGGALTTTKNVLKALSGILSLSGSVSKSTGRLLVGTLIQSGSLLKRTFKYMEGSVSFTGTVSFVRQYLRLLIGALSMSGTVTKQVNKEINGNLSSIGTLVKQMYHACVGILTPVGELSSVRRYILFLSGVLTNSGILVKKVDKKLFGSLDWSGIIYKNTNKSVNGVINITGTINKLSNKFVSGVVTFIKELTGYSFIIKTTQVVLPARQMTLNPEYRSNDFELPSRNNSLQLNDRQVIFNLPTRSVVLHLEGEL